MEQALLGMYTREHAALAHGPIGSSEGSVAFMWTWAVAREKHEEAAAIFLNPKVSKSHEQKKKKNVI